MAEEPSEARGAHEACQPNESKSLRRACASGGMGQARRAVLIVATLAGVLLPAARGDNFRYGDIRWASCYRGEGDFYDPKFPEVCRDRSSRLRVGFTITAAWSVVQNTERSMLQNAAIDIPNFINNVGNCQSSQRGCPLMLSRATNFPSRERRIAYRRGLSERVSNGAGGFTYYDLTRPVNTPDAIITCPVANPPPELDCTTAAIEFRFSIDRLSADGFMIHARYSFEILFPQDGEYTVYFEGCCRPTSSLSDPDIYVLNNFDRTFHIRTGVVVYSAPHVMPKMSVRFTMPHIVDLRFQSNKGDTSSCSIQACNGCTQSFRIQAYHPQENLKTFGTDVTFRIATVYEMGLYKCVEHAPATDPNPLIPNNWEFLAVRCPDYVSAANPQYGAPYTDPTKLSVSADGIVTFSTQTFGVWQLTVMADVLVNDPTQNRQRLLSTPVDFLIRVSQADGNLNQPDGGLIRSDIYADYLDLQQFTQAALRNNPISIACGRTSFSVPSRTGGVLSTTETLTIGFRDLDSSHAGAPCSNEPQYLQWIAQVADMPKGLKIGNLTRIKSGNIDTGRGTIPINWRPRCEDLSQVGLFQFCFFARDQYSGSGFSQLISVPTPVTILGAGNSVEIPSCVFVRSLAPPATNPSPQFLQPTSLRSCSQDCCRCCGDLGCPCDVGGRCMQCPRVFAQARTLFKYPILATDSDPFTNITFALTFPTGGSDLAYPDDVYLTQTLIANGVSKPYLRPTKYGCGGTPYDSCVSNPSNSSYASTELVWDLATGAFVCYQGTTKTSTICSGESDTSCGAGKTCAPNRVDIPSFKVCYQAVEVVPSFVDRTAWQSVYGTTPDNSSCLVCFLLNAANEPKWMDDNTDATKPHCEGSTASSFNLAVGETTTIKLEAQDTAPNQNNFRISVLADPGAPNGAHLTPMVSLPNNRFSRDFVFTPQLGQENTEYTVCFQATNDNNLKSVKCCPVLRVNSGEPLWGLTKVFDARQNCYVGCPWSAALTGVPPSQTCLNEAADNAFCPADGVMDVTVGCQYKMSVAVVVNNANYNVRLRVKQLPNCPTCVPGGISVTSCADMGGDSMGMMDYQNNTGSMPPGPACCGNNICDGAETGQNCPSDCPPDEATLEPNPAFPNDPMRAIFTFMPTRIQQGRQLLTCIEVYDVANGAAVISQRRVPGQGIAPSLCIVYNVESCRYCVPAGSTLKSISKHYLLNVDWLRLYNSNPMIPNPNSLIPSDLSDAEPIYIGPRYTVEPGDTLLSIAAIMRTTVKSILENNPILTPDGMLEVGTKLCLLLCSNA